MMAMMPIQSLIMMYEAGFGWQFGKRKASELSNEEVKQMTLLTVMEHMNQMRRDALPMIKKAMDDMTPMTAHLMENFGDIIREMVKAIPQTFSNIFTQSYQGPNDPYGQITNVRLSQGSQQYQRDRELYAGGPSAESLFERDQAKQKERDRQQAILEANAERENKRLAEIKARLLIEDSLPAGTKELHQRWARVSTQTISMQIRASIQNITVLYANLQKMPRTIQVEGRKNVNQRSVHLKLSKRPGPRWVKVWYTRANPAIPAQQAKIKAEQLRVLNMQKYLTWRKAGSPIKR